MSERKKMLAFVDQSYETPTKREAKERLQDFSEIYSQFTADNASNQASRCSQCGVPYCQSHCPLHNNIPDWLRLVCEDRLEEAYIASQATNAFPEICGRICPQDRLCEGHCVIEQAGHKTVTIGAVEKYITDMAWKKGWVTPLTVSQERLETVGIIGAGPGGLSAALTLRQAGIQVTIYDRYDRAGGLLTYGIPNFKLEKDVVMRRIKQCEDSNVKFCLNVDVGKDISFQELRAKHGAVLIATGVYKPRTLSDAQMISARPVMALDFLIASNKINFGDEVIDFSSGLLNAKNKRVVVIGGGDTAMDCVRTAVRQGAKSVKCLYRRDRVNMPGSLREVSNAEEEGVEFIWLSTPKAFLGNPADTIKVQKMRLGKVDATGRRNPEPISDETYDEEADLIILALGFEPENLSQQWKEKRLSVTNWGTIRADFKTHATSLEGVYACGDIQRGASLVVWAIRDGKQAADAILEFFNQKQS